MFPVDVARPRLPLRSGWKDYQQTELSLRSRCPPDYASPTPSRPIFTRQLKTRRHDENISFDQMVQTIARKPAEDLPPLR